MHPYCHRLTTQTHAKGHKRVSEKLKFSKIIMCHKKNKTLQYQGVQGAHGPTGTTWA